MLTPHVRTVAAALHSYRSAWAGLLHDPANPLTSRRLDDAAYTLRVHIGQRNAADAATQAQRLLAGASARVATDRATQEITASRGADAEPGFRRGTAGPPRADEGMEDQ
ncbi:DUF5133 domain-containing protein [Streptomyces sp. NPDC002676]